MGKAKEKYMSFLKKFGQGALKVFGIAQQLEPIATGFIGGSIGTLIHDVFSRIGNVVLLTERIATTLGGEKTGAAKLQAASDLALPIIQASELVAGKKIRDEAAFAAACQKITSGVADLLNSLSAE
jgi:hypothetical protein